jgi:hypothetical protein
VLDPESERIAADYVRRLGGQAVLELLENAKFANWRRDPGAADTWREIAEAARRLAMKGLSTVELGGIEHGS